MDSKAAASLRRLKHRPALLHANALELLRATTLISLSFMLWVPIATHAAGVPTLNEVVVKAKSNNLIGSANSANEGTVLKKQLDQRVVYRPGELLETVPGLIVTQHSGEGKANQYFARGFNLDHGTDLRISVDGMLVNQRSHGHGQSDQTGWRVNWLSPGPAQECSCSCLSRYFDYVRNRHCYGI